MSLVLETEDGRFEAATQREVLALARKARRKAEREERDREDVRKLAYARAREAGYRLYSLGLREGGPPRGIRLLDRDDHPSIEQRIQPGARGDALWYQSEVGGRAEASHPGYRVRGLVQDGGGWDLGVVLVDRQDSARTEFLALGIADGQAAFVDLPGLCWVLFEHRKGELA